MKNKQNRRAPRAQVRRVAVGVAVFAVSVALGRAAGAAQAR